MSLKKISMITVLAAAQVSTVVPVSAQSSAALQQPSAVLEQPAALQEADNNNPRIGEGAPEAANSAQPEPNVEQAETLESSPEADAVQPSQTPEIKVVPEENSANDMPPTSSSGPAASLNKETNELVLLMNRAEMYHNSKLYTAAQPMAVKSGVSYISIRAIVERAGLMLRYDNATKETIIYKDGNELRFTMNSTVYKVNGEARSMKGPAYTYKGTFMVPLTSITQALGIRYVVNQPEKKVILDLSSLSGSAPVNPGEGASGGEPANPSTPPVETVPGLVLLMNSAQMYHNGTSYTAAKPMAVKQGVSYVAVRSLVDRVGFSLRYDSSTKETVIMRGSDEIRFKTNSSVYTVNGVRTTMKGPAYQDSGTFMVPLTSITQALNIPYQVDQQNKRVILSLSTKPIASFTVTNPKVYVGQTVVNYKTSAYSPSGLPIVSEYWDGREDVFYEPGIHTVSYSVQDSSGEWSDPYTLNIEVLVPNEPPAALFTTNKEEYRMGELITYTDQSTDEENAIVSREWDNNAKAFFTPGPVKVRLKVTDRHGAVDTYEKTIVITGETLYTREEFYQLYAAVGEKFFIDGARVPSLPVLPLESSFESRTLIRSNSPETVTREGVVYREVGVGATRFMIHHKNASGKVMKMYVVATNLNSTPASLNTQHVGFGGPSEYPNATGKLSVERYFQSMQSGSSNQTSILQPGESRLILTEINALPIKDQQVVSLFADLFTDSPIRYDVIMIEEKEDALSKFPFLPLLAADGIHNRGTYANSTRILESRELIGQSEARIAIGDKNLDPFLTGYDGITGYPISNSGNFGMVYHIKLNRVAPNTLISFNPRGGKYMGSVMVNGSMVNVPSTSWLSAPHDSSVLFRTGEYEQPVEIWFTAAPGSSLPVNILVTPMPQKRN
ncbi:copper amine oxidase N-terminal domain protein [Paenibacillus algicola]|uniref:Copper amine oxidase N-terminal domain protein n=1 Tax=Paenibacillus algicola TaxID=2565926 RepID=A0A4P8XJ84_9BACL|nr:stalk domain-containing protein [Paenibacillus algicola]QCT02435.1 copper amine oxidase N-terminal domain protein [Paenibacillus algicola]